MDSNFPSSRSPALSLSLSLFYLLSVARGSGCCVRRADCLFILAVKLKQQRPMLLLRQIEKDEEEEEEETRMKMLTC